MFDDKHARCYLNVSADRILQNLKVVRNELEAKTQVIAVLKADAYGLGSVEIGKKLFAEGIKDFAVACLEEAFELHNALPDARILCMGETLDGAIEQAVQKKIRLTAGSQHACDRIMEAATRCKMPAYVHFKIDTGLHRIGFGADEAVELISRLRMKGRIVPEGLYTHLALRNETEDIIQHQRFEKVVVGLAGDGICPPVIHMLDSIGIIRYPRWQYNAVRIGAFLYGNYPNGYQKSDEIKIPYAFMTRIVRIFDVSKGECIGYDESHPVKRDSKIAVLCCGYADGYPRVMSNRGYVSVRGAKAPIVGLICMDQMMVDVTDIPFVEVGDEVCLLGGDKIDPREYAAIGCLNRNECTAIIGKRVPRIML